MDENLKSLASLERVRDDTLDNMAPYLNKLWFKVVSNSLTKHSKRPQSSLVTN